MIRYSHVSLVVLCDTAAEADAVTTHLGVQPTRIRESKAQSWCPKGGHGEKVSWSWTFDSPKSHTEADVPERLWTLAEAIAPFAERLRTLKSAREPWVDVVYHNTPQHPHGITGEFHWFRMPVEIMRRFSVWDLSISYEVFWFDHPDWVSPKRSGWFRRFSQWIRRGWSN
jgi:hypothetical protein